MRWDRLFGDLEAGADEIAKVEAEALAQDLRDEIWAQTSWRAMLGGRVTLEVRGAGQVSGEVAAVNDQLMRLRADVLDHLVAVAAVTSVLQQEGRTDPPGRLDGALGWASALRRLRDGAEPVRVTLDDGRTVDGQVQAVGRDFVRLAAGPSHLRLLVLGAISMVTSTH